MYKEAIIEEAAKGFIKKSRFRNIKRDDNDRIWFAEDPETGDSLSF